MTETSVNLTIEGVHPYRALSAARQNRMYAEAEALLGPAKAYGAWHLTDRRGVLPTRVVYCCQRGGSGWQPTCEEAFPQCLERDYLTDAYVVYTPGKPCIVGYRFRFECSFGSIEQYHPLSAAELEQRRQAVARRKAERAVAKEKSDHPLFFQET